MSAFRPPEILTKSWPLDSLLEAPRRNEALRSEQQDEGDRHEHKGLAEDAKIRRKQRLKQDGDRADEEAAQRCAAEIAKATDHRADEGYDDELRSHARLYQSGLRDHQAADDSRQKRADRKGCRDDPIGPHAEHLGHTKVFRRRPHLKAKPCRPQEPCETSKQNSADDDGHELEQLQPDAGDLYLL